MRLEQHLDGQVTAQFAVAPPRTAPMPPRRNLAEKLESRPSLGLTSHLGRAGAGPGWRLRAGRGIVAKPDPGHAVGREGLRLEHPGAAGRRTDASRRFRQAAGVPAFLVFRPQPGTTTGAQKLIRHCCISSCESIRTLDILRAKAAVFAL